MSTSTDAYLGYGYAWNQEVTELDYELHDNDDSEDEYVDIVDEGSFFDRCGAVNKKYPLIEMDGHCYIDNPMPFITIKRLYQRAYRGDVELVQFQEPTEEEQKQVDAALKEFGWKKPHAMGWFLVSYWG